MNRTRLIAPTMRISIGLILAAGLVAVYGFEKTGPPKPLGADMQAALDSIRPDALRGDLSFLASDLLEGRNTPSRGLDIAAEYIAAQFRSAGLEPGGDDGYFQTAQMVLVEPDLSGFELSLTHGDRTLSVKPDEATLSVDAALQLDNTLIFKLDLGDESLIEHLTPADVDGKVLIIEVRRNNVRKLREALAKLRDAKPALRVVVDRANATGPASHEGRLLDPSEQASVPRIGVSSESAAAFYASLKPGLSEARASVRIAQPHRTQVKLHNVIGVLRGSDPQVKDTAELLTAHYDHVGEKPDGPGDRIFNGANDDGSGTVSVIEIARALARLPKHPRRSVVFMTFFGEEKGLLGSHYYARHPVWPIERTILQLNLEQVGRTDDSEGAQVSKVSLTGLTYTDFADYLKQAGELTSIHVNGNSRNTDLYFTASDNLSLAEAGVPAHTLCVAFEFPDYHGVGDEWQKIDYDNMAKVDRAAALALLLVSDGDQAPAWNANNPRTAPYLKAWKEHHK